MNSLSRAGFGSAAVTTLAPQRRRPASLDRAEADLAARLIEALIAADALGLTEVGIRLDQALVELTGIGFPIDGVELDAPGH
jgi:hypothetical protein